jgi:RimJ/RimL family protein N-acetyltransferase
MTVEALGPAVVHTPPLSSMASLPLSTQLFAGPGGQCAARGRGFAMACCHTADLSRAALASGGMDSFPSPAIRSDRLDLREFGADDLGLASEVAVAGEREALPPGVPVSRDELAEWFANGMHVVGRDTAVHLMMLDRARGQMVGSISLFHADWEVRSAEIGYGVRSDARGQGYATEALAAVARWALTEGGIQRAWLTTNTDNAASGRVAEKVGFRREGTLRRAGREDDGLHDLAIYSLLDDELPELRTEVLSPGSRAVGPRPFQPHAMPRKVSGHTAR